MPAVHSSSHRRHRAGLAALVAAALAVFMTTVPLTGLAASAASPASASGAGSGRVQVVTPRPGSVHVARDKAAATRTHFRARLRLSGPTTAVTAKLNGHPLPLQGHGRGTRTAVLDRASGLVVGQNLLWVSATVNGSTSPVQTADRFVVGYPVGDLLTSSGVQRGSGAAPAALVTVQAPLAGVNQITATLNRRTLHLPDARPDGQGHRTLDLNLAQIGDLRFGRNQLDLRLVMDDGRVQRVRHTFTLDRRRDIAAARVVGRAPAVGRTVTLDASASRLAHGRKLDTHWLLLRKPQQSHARLGASTGATTSLRPDVPGTYQVAMRTGTGAGAGYDVLTVGASYPKPLVPIDSGATEDGKSGLEVGTSFYPYDDQAIQVTVLDGYTLEMLHHYSDPATGPALAGLTTDLSDLPGSDVVVITAPDGQPLVPNDQVGTLDDALSMIGGSLGANQIFGNSTCWSGRTFTCTDYYDPPKYDNTWTKNSTAHAWFTVIGYPGMPSGQAWRETSDQTKYGGTPTGRFIGYLTPDVPASGGTTSRYTVIHGPDPYVPVDTCADVGNDTCAVTVGDHTYPATAGGDGFHVVVLDRTTLALLSNQTVSTFEDLHTAINTSHSGTPPQDHPVVHYVVDGGQGDQKLVIIQSVGDGKLTGTPPGSIWTGYIWQDLSELGGTPESLKASADGSQRYALVGVANNLPWYGTAGVESSTVMATGTAPGQASGQVSGEFRRDRTGLYTPTGGDPGGPINTEFYSILYQPAQDWPYADDPALPYIASGIGLSGYPDVRSAYTNLNADFSYEAVLLNNLTCTGQSFCGPDFDTVKAQLLEEFGWVQTVRNFIDNLKSPYHDTGAQSIFAVDAIYDDIYNSLPPPPPVDTGLDWLGIVKQVVGIASTIGVPGAGEASKALSVASTGINLANDFLQSDDGGTADTVDADAPDQLANKLADQQTAAVQGMDRMETILLSDYGRLSAVGSKAAGDPSWAWTSDTTADSVSALNASTRAASYTSLIPEIYQVTDLEPGTDVNPPDVPPPTNYYTTNDVTQYQCHDGHHPFAKALGDNQFQAVTRDDVYQGRGTLRDVWLFANDVPSGSPQMPTTSLTDDIYGPDSTGPDGAFQYAPDWWRRTFNPPGGIVCYPSLYASYPWDAPDIPQPLP